MVKKSTKAFIDHVKSECAKYGIKCKLKPVSYLRLSNNIKCSGYFDESSLELVCAMNREDSLEILVHEYAHMTQWLDNCDIWKKMIKYDSVNKMDAWLSKKEVVRDYKKHIDIVKYLELDNEKRSVNIIKKFNLDIDLDHYIKKANAYVQFYNHIKTTRRWSTPKNSPYTNVSVINVMSPTFRMNYRKMSKKVIKAFQISGI
jgi:hypothetical protein